MVPGSLCLLWYVAHTRSLFYENFINVFINHDLCDVISKIDFLKVIGKRIIFLRLSSIYLYHVIWLILKHYAVLFSME